MSALVTDHITVLGEAIAPTRTWHTQELVETEYMAAKKKCQQQLKVGGVITSQWLLLMDYA